MIVGYLNCRSLGSENISAIFNSLVHGEDPVQTHNSENQNHSKRKNHYSKAVILSIQL